MVGRTLGKYHIAEALGRGGMGTVYRAVDETLDREVAIKVLNPELMDAETVQRFRHEAITLAKLNHPRIAHLYELTREGDNLLMVMEYVRGETLEKLSTRIGPLPIDRAIGFCSQALEAVHHAHSVGIVHRDLKPANLMLTAAGDVKVMDFGIARVAGTEHMTNEGLMMGTPAYMAPEQVRGREVDARTDVYAIAVVLYRLLTAQLPFRADTAVAMIQSQLKDPPTASRLYRAELPEWLDGILNRALAKEPADRFQTAEELRAALLCGLTGVATPISAATPGFAVDPSTATPAGTGDTSVGAELSLVLRPPDQASTPPTLASGQTTVTLRRRHLARGVAITGVAAAVLGTLFAIRNLRQTATLPAAGSNQPESTERTPSPTAAAPVAATSAAADIRPRPSTRSASSTARGREEPAARERASEPPLTFGDVKMLVGEDARTRESDVLLTLQEGRISVRGSEGAAVIKSIPYRSVVSASYSRSKRAGALGTIAGVFVSAKHWLTLRSRDDFLVLHLDKDNVNLIIAAVETRTGVKVQRLDTR